MLSTAASFLMHCLLVATTAVGRDSLLKKLVAVLLEVSTWGVLLHGMGGIGKSTVAHQLCSHFKASSQFPGGVYSVTVLSDEQQRSTRRGLGGATPSSALLLRAQKELLQRVIGRDEPLAFDRLPEGKHRLEQEFKKKAGAVLVLVDNVPEEGGIRDLLPSDTPPG